MEVVSNSSPIIHLSKIGRLDLLKFLFDTIKIPEAVYKECVIEGGYRPEVKIIRDAKWIKVVNIKDTNLTKLLKAEVDEGEAEAIALALEIGAEIENLQLGGFWLRKDFVKKILKIVDEI